MKKYRKKYKNKNYATSHNLKKELPVLEKEFGIKRFVKLESGKIIGAYIGNDIMHPRKVESKDGNYYIYFSEYKNSTFIYQREKIIASSDKIGDLNG